MNTDYTFSESSHPETKKDTAYSANEQYSQLASHVLKLIQSRIKLFQIESSEHIKGSLRQLVFLAISAVLALLTWVIICYAMIHWLASTYAWELYSSSLLIAAIHGLLALICFAIGKQKPAHQGIPLTQQELNKDIQWLKSTLAKKK